MRPPPPLGHSNGVTRPPHPNARPPPQQRQQQPQLRPSQPPAQSGAGRSPVMSPFQKSEGGFSGPSPQQPLGQSFRPVQNSPPSHGQQSIQMNTGRPPGVPAAPAVPGSSGANHQRPQQSPQQQQHHLQQPQQIQQSQRPQPPLGGYQSQFAHSGRPLPGPTNAGSQGNVRLPDGSPQSQPLQVHPRPPVQHGQQQGQQGQQHLLSQHLHQPGPISGLNLRPSASNPNLSSKPESPAGARLAPASPNVATTRSPQIRPLHPSQPHQGPPISHQSELRPSLSHPHLAQVRPPTQQPPSHNSPAHAHQTLAIRPPTPTIQQQHPRPRPPPGAPFPGQGPMGAGVRPQGQPSPRLTPMQSIQVEIPIGSTNSLTNGGSHKSLPLDHSSTPRKTILEQMQQPPQHIQQNSMQALTQRPSQRPHAPVHGQPGPHLQGSNAGSPQRVPVAGGQQQDASQMNSADQIRKEQTPTYIQTQIDEHGRPQQHVKSPYPHLNHTGQHGGIINHSGPISQQGRPGHPSQLQQLQNLQHPQQERQFNVPPSPGQRPLRVTVPDVKDGTPPQPQNPPSLPVPPSLTHQHQPESEDITLLEPDAPLSDSNEEFEDDNDIEGGAPKQFSPQPKTSAVDTTGDKAGPPPPQQQPSATAGGGPPLGPPRGPPKHEAVARKLSSVSGSAPVQILQPSNNPSSPPASAFPPIGQPRSRIRPPPNNKSHTPYRPPERPSQTPVMYSQSGQPAFSQPLPQQIKQNNSENTTEQSPLLTQGAESVSSSVRPKEGGLHRRIVAGENNASKSDAPAASPPSPKTHSVKGPAILSVSGHRASSPKAKSLKTWAIRGGLMYLGYTALFNCGGDPSGVRGLYCKATNGVGGVLKPFVAPHYNAHVGPHVDKYVKPVARQGHKIYVKVADPVVQGAFSVAGNIYKSTAKKHVDSAKDQVISILPFPFKTKTGPLVDDEESNKEYPSSFEKVSRQPVLVDNPQSFEEKDAVENKEQLSHSKDQAVDTLKEKLQQVEQKSAEGKEVVFEQLTPAVETVNHIEETVESVHHEDTPVKETEKAEDHYVEQDSKGLGDDDHVVVDEHKQDILILDKIGFFQDSMKRLDNEVVAEADALSEETYLEHITGTEDEKKKEHEEATAPELVVPLEIDAQPEQAAQDESLVTPHGVEEPESTLETSSVPAILEASAAEPSLEHDDNSPIATSAESLAAEYAGEEHSQPLVEPTPTVEATLSQQQSDIPSNSAVRDNADISQVQEQDAHGSIYSLREDEQQGDIQTVTEEGSEIEHNDKDGQQDEDGTGPLEQEQEDAAAGSSNEEDPQQAHAPDTDGSINEHDEL
ncbi:hypothetical protein BG004_004375 [Podila humilis]|nr:hypothetical protein BG004_004375 [Podila humilis]